MTPYFQLDPEVIYLNHAAVAPWPLRTAQAVKAFADENARQGSKDYELWLRREKQLRSQLAQLINAPSTDAIALLKSTSEGLSLIAYGLPWQAGDNIVIPAEEFPSNRIVWQSLQPLGVETRLIPISGVPDPEQALIDAIDRRTRVLSCSSVQYASGLRLDLERLGQACQGRMTLFCVDAIQSIGALRFDVQACQADFVVADGHKWMLGPEGTALFYCREGLIEQLALKQFGWHMVQEFSDYNRMDWRPHQTAQRFECGSPNMMGVVALHASTALLHEIGMEVIERQVLAISARLIDKLQAVNDIEILSPLDQHRRAGIVLFKHKQVDTDGLYRHLQEHNVICALRGEGIRFSPHFYTTEAMLDAAIDRISGYQ
ncbi:MAG: aminotransferase class V-fold PLP-dependent enzyme [Gammaproteobacteria bacterium]|nr:aminotransferase class V-fold PLP-dependent enzyme [Gammaproteobacteria bacterium]